MNRTLLSETELIKSAADGDADAFGELVARNEKRIYSFALGMLSNPDDAFDAAQETFLKAYRSMRFFKGDSAFYTWLYSICRNCCYDFIKARARHRRHNISLFEYENDDDGSVIEIPDDESRPDALYEQRRTREVVMNAIKKLPANHREIVLLRDIDGLSYEEIAAVIGVSVGTVKSRLNRARATLRELIKDNI